MAKIIKIDTSNNKKISIVLEVDGKQTEVFSESTLLRSEACLPLIDKLLRENKLSIFDLNEIEVYEGPGSFTGLRIGAAIANTLGEFLKIPINHKKIGDLALPVYND